MRIACLHTVESNVPVFEAAAASASKKARTGPGSSLVIDVASGGSSGEGDCGSGQ